MKSKKQQKQNIIKPTLTPVDDLNVDDNQNKEEVNMINEIANVANKVRFNIIKLNNKLTLHYDAKIVKEMSIDVQDRYGDVGLELFNRMLNDIKIDKLASSDLVVDYICNQVTRDGISLLKRLSIGGRSLSFEVKPWIAERISKVVNDFGESYGLVEASDALNEQQKGELYEATMVVFQNQYNREMVVCADM